MPAADFFDARTAYLTMGVLDTVLPLTVWQVLRGRHDAAALRRWTIGGLCLGAMCLLIGLRTTVPWLMGYSLASMLGFASYVLRADALRREIGRGHPLAALAAVVALASLGYEAAWRVDAELRVMYTAALQAAGAAWVSRCAFAWHQAQPGHGARIVAHSHAVLAAAVALRLLAMASGATPVRVPSNGWDGALVFAAALVAVVLGNLGYVGMVLQRLAARENSAERHARSLEAALAERDALLGVLAHEVRQPLNNASAALESAVRAIGSPTGNADIALTRLARTQAVLDSVVGSVNNVLAAGALLLDRQAFTVQDTDLDMLIGLAIEDLSADARRRVAVTRHTDLRSADLNPGLMRLALRNLLVNAADYSPPDSPVELHVREHEDPPALVLEVHDQGDGIEGPLVEQMFERGTRGPNAAGKPGAGLGLYIVRRVADLHRGRVELCPRTGGGTTARLVLPQVALL